MESKNVFLRSAKGKFPLVMEENNYFIGEKLGIAEIAVSQKKGIKVLRQLRHFCSLVSRQATEEPDQLGLTPFKYS
ncbi:MAG: hypothetical protein ACKN87_22015 [Microcystis aeruginosa]